MSTSVRDPLIVVATYLWLGFVTAISFMEAWLKFRAPGVTIPIGLGIGRLVFNALNKAEWIFAIAIFAGILISKQDFFAINKVLFYLPFVLLLAQTIWILPALDNRAEMVIKGVEVADSPLHLYYVIVEIIKVSSLFIFGIIQFK